MIIMISGGSHTGKTVLAQKLLEQYHMPYLSIDHLKMGLIRSGHTQLTPLDSDEALTEYLWPIVWEMIKTAIENEQHLIVEGIYIPFDWAKDFEKEYLAQIRHVCLVMTEEYIREHVQDICQHANDVEKRLEDEVDVEEMIRENQKNLRRCMECGCEYILIQDHYDVVENMAFCDRKPS